MNLGVFKQKAKNTLLFSMCRPGLLLPKYTIDLSKIPIVNVTSDQIIDLNETTNNIKKIQFYNSYKYFRKCSSHDIMIKYVLQIVDDYFSDSPDCKTKKWIIDSLVEKNNLRLFFNMGVTNDKYSNVYRYYKTNDSTLIGIATPRCEVVNEEIKSFVQFAWGEIYNYKLNNGLRHGQFQIYNACRGLATKAIADLLGLEELIPKSQYVRLRIDAKTEIFGTLMDQAPGELVKWAPPEKRKSMITPQLQHSLNNLNLLDVICYERDHKPSNYNVLLDENQKGLKVCAFDNDSPLTFFIYSSAQFKTYMNCAPYIYNKRIMRPYIDKKLAETVLSLNIKKLANITNTYLSKIQIITMKSRFSILRQCIKNSILKGFLHPIEDNEWNTDTEHIELSGKYGKTYLNLFAEDLHLPKQDWIR